MEAGCGQLIVQSRDLERLGPGGGQGVASNVLRPAPLARMPLA
jgi:hypothetical protein